MRSWLRRLRAVIGIGTIWGLPAAIVGAIGGFAAGVFGGAPLLGSVAAGSVAVGGLFFLLGSGFATALTLAERRRTLGELSPWRAALWGALAGAGALATMVLISFGPAVVGLLSDPQLLTGLLAGIGSYAALGGALAGGTVAVAKQAPPKLGSGAGEDEPEVLGGTGTRAPG